MGRANARNRNGRVYPKPLLQREAAKFYDRHVRHRRALGELDHPPPTSPTFRCLNDSNVSHQVLDYFWKGDDLMGYVEVLPTKAGGMLRDLYVAGFQLGMSSRGWATLKDEDGFIVIQEDFELITFDFVSDPSTEGAYLRPLQRRYDTLRPPIDIHETYDEFMRASAQGQAYLKKRAASGEAPAPAPASSAAKTGFDEKNAHHHPAAAQKPRAASVPASVPGGSGLEHARIAQPPPATLVACEASKARRAPAGARDAAPGTPPRAEPPRARVEQSRTPSRALSSRNGERESAFGGTGTKEKGGWVLRSPRRNKVAPRPATPVLSLRESWNRLALRDGLRGAAA